MTSRERTKTVRAYELNDSDLVGDGFMSYRQWGEAEKLRREDGNEKKRVSISLLLHLSLDEGRNERSLQQNCLSLMNYNPSERDTTQKTMVVHKAF